MGICKLCLEDKILIKKSHIIPDFMYRDLYDEKHNIYSLDFVNLKRAKSKSEIISKKASTGEYETFVLCAECDNNVIGSLESYASKILHGGKFHDRSKPITNNYLTPNREEYTVVKNVDCKQFKLFLLSILWRSSISRRDFFSQVYLGPHENNIRLLINNDFQDFVNEYPVLILTSLKDKTSPNEMILQPEKVRTREGVKFYRFIIGGFIYFFFINSIDYKLPDFVNDFKIKENHDIVIVHLPEGKKRDFLLN